jgi:hypothetical protein
MMPKLDICNADALPGDNEAPSVRSQPSTTPSESVALESEEEQRLYGAIKKI